MNRCSECEYAKYLKVSQEYLCEYPDLKDVILYSGKTKPHACPKSGGKKYFLHGNDSGDWRPSRSIHG